MSRSTPTTHEGLKFKSLFEKEIYIAAKRNGMNLEYETTYIPYKIKGSYNPDFILPNGIIVEAKGYLDAGACRKMKAVKESNPDLDIRFVFMNSNKRMRKSSKMTYGDWCERYGFPYAEYHIPLSWYNE